VPGNPTMRVLRNRFADGGFEGPLLGGVDVLYFGGDMEASVANTGEVSSWIADLLPVAEIVRRTGLEIETALDGARSRI